MAIDLMGPRFYTQQMSTSKGGAKKVGRLKKDIVKDIEKIMGMAFMSLPKVTNIDLEKLYDALKVHKR